MTVKEIKKELYLIDALQKEATLEVYSEGICVYHFQIGENKLYEINIIAHSEFFRNMKVVDILDSKEIFYLSCSVYLFSNKTITKRINTMEFAPNVTNDLN